MRFLLSVIDRATRADALDAGVGTATSDEAAAIDAFNDRLRAEGHWVFAAGVGSPSTATLVDNRDGARVVTSGPFVQTDEYQAGFWIVEAPDVDAAIALAVDGSSACHRKVEVRPLL